MHIAPSIPGSGTVRPSSEQASPRLVAAAHQFEASLMQELLKPLQSQGGPFSEDGSEQDENGVDAISGFGTEALAQGISAHGGLGIAKQLIGKLSRDPA